MYDERNNADDTQSRVQKKDYEIQVPIHRPPYLDSEGRLERN